MATPQFSKRTEAIIEWACWVGSGLAFAILVVLLG